VSVCPCAPARERYVIGSYVCVFTKWPIYIFYVFMCSCSLYFLNNCTNVVIFLSCIFSMVSFSVYIVYILVSLSVNLASVLEWSQYVSFPLRLLCDINCQLKWNFWYWKSFGRTTRPTLKGCGDSFNYLFTALIRQCFFLLQRASYVLHHWHLWPFTRTFCLVPVTWTLNIVTLKTVLFKFFWLSTLFSTR
jgi:hypothetical protein